VYAYDEAYTENFLSLIKGSMTRTVQHFTIEEAVRIREEMLNLGAITGERLYTHDLLP
jgi:hypothetical protein